MDAVKVCVEMDETFSIQIKNEIHSFFLYFFYLKIKNKKMEETFQSSSTSPNETNCYTWNNADFKYLSRTFDVFGYFALLFLVIYIVMNSLIFCCGQKHIFRSAILQAKFRKFIQHRARK